MKDYDAYRASARQGIERAGGMAVMIEDEPARAESPRNACLDLVASCDAVVTIVGPRGGFRAPSGELVVKEEFDEAQLRGLPVVVLLDDTERDADAEELARQLSDWEGGRLRRVFSSLDELATELENALTPLLRTMNRPAQDPSIVQALVEETHHGGGQYDAVLRLVLAPAVADEVIDPLDIGKSDFRMEVLRLGHDCQLVDYERAKRPQASSDRLTIRQGSDRGRGHGYVEVTIACSGLIDVRVQVTGQTDHSGLTRGSLSNGFEILRSDLVRAGTATFDFAAHVLTHVDSPGRYGSWIYNAALLNPTGRKIVERRANASQAISMGFNQPEVVSAYDQPRPINRRVLSQPDSEVARVVTLLERRLEEARRF